MGRYTKMLHSTPNTFSTLNYKKKCLDALHLGTGVPNKHALKLVLHLTYLNVFEYYCVLNVTLFLAKLSVTVTVVYGLL